MGLLVEGRWQDRWYDTKSTGGRFKRQESAFRDWVSRDGAGGYAGEPGRYRLIVSYACPWAHRTLVVRALKGLQDAIALTVVDPLMGERGWILPDGRPLYELYLAVDPGFTGRVTVPVLWDERDNTIVNNESAEIIRMLNSAFPSRNEDLDLYPAALRGEIDAVNAMVYDTVNNGVYKCGFATTQDAYEEAFDALFAALDDLEARLSRQRWLVGRRFTEADVRLVTTLWRFDPVYYGHFKCNKKRLVDYPNLWGLAREVCQLPGVAETVHLDHIKRHYYASHTTINPTGIVPKGPVLDYGAPAGREHLDAEAIPSPSPTPGPGPSP